MNFETAQTTYGPSDRLSGILLHPTSLPSPYGIGDLGDGAYEFIDFLNKAGRYFHLTRPDSEIPPIRVSLHLPVNPF